MSAATRAKPLCGQHWTMGTTSPKAEDSPWWFLHQLRVSYSKWKAQLCWGLERNNFWECQRFMCCLETSWLSKLSSREGDFVGNQRHVFQHLFLYISLFSPWNAEALCIPLHPCPLQDREQLFPLFLERMGNFRSRSNFDSFPHFSFIKGSKIYQVISNLVCAEL